MKKQYLILGLVIAMSAAGCGGASKEALYTRGPMPFEGNFDGVYQSDFGRMELTVESGERVVGLYEKNDIFGRIEGNVKDNLLIFNWTQWNVEMRGKIRETNGRGVFQYMIDEHEGGKPSHWLKGFWSYNRDEPVNPWKAYKLGTKAKKKLVPFDPASYTGDEEEEEDDAEGFQSNEGSYGSSSSDGSSSSGSSSNDDSISGDDNLF